MYRASTLNHYANTEGPYQSQALEVYNKLRDGIVNNVMKVYYK